MRVIKDLKEFVALWNQNDLLFTYKLLFYKSGNYPQLVLKQAQTQFSLNMAFDPCSEVLEVSNFQLSEDPHLEKVCQPLYDASLIELILQGLLLLMFFAKRIDKEEIRFTIAVQDAEHLARLQDLFETTSVIITIQGRRQVFALSTCTHWHEEFLERVESIKIDLRQQLWVKQRNSSTVRQYFQHQNRSNIKILEHLNNATNPEPLSKWGMIISFPQGSNL